MVLLSTRASRQWSRMGGWADSSGHAVRPGRASICRGHAGTLGMQVVPIKRLMEPYTPNTRVTGWA